MRIAAVLLLCSVAAVTPAVAQVRSAAAVKWGPGPGFLPAGARLAVLQGDPSKSGVLHDPAPAARGLQGAAAFPSHR